jgi:SprT protein
VSKNTELLKRFIPEEAAPLIARWVDHLQVELKITRSRETVLGDYRHPFGDKGHRISINNDLNPYAFLVTLIHEFAHLIQWNKYRNNVKPHGDEWKMEYKRLMQPFFEMNIFPDKIRHALEKYLKDPAASSCADPLLLRVLREFDANKNTVLVSSIPPGGIFSMRNGRKFQKLEKVRTRYQCKEVGTGRIYLFSAIAEVYLV